MSLVVTSVYDAANSLTNLVQTYISHLRQEKSLNIIYYIYGMRVVGHTADQRAAMAEAK